jgi:hypothetical protein
VAHAAARHGRVDIALDEQGLTRLFVERAALAQLARVEHLAGVVQHRARENEPLVQGDAMCTGGSEQRLRCLGDEATVRDEPLGRVQLGEERQRFVEGPDTTHGPDSNGRVDGSRAIRRRGVNRKCAVVHGV